MPKHKTLKVNMSVRTAKEKLIKIFKGKRPPMKPPMKEDKK